MKQHMKQYLQLKFIKVGWSKLWFRCASSTGYSYIFDLYFGKKYTLLN